MSGDLLLEDGFARLAAEAADRPGKSEAFRVPTQHEPRCSAVLATLLLHAPLTGDCSLSAVSATELGRFRRIS